MVADRTTLLPQTAPGRAPRTTPFQLDSSQTPAPFSQEELAALEALELPGSDGVPLESDRKRLQINLGLESLDEQWKERKYFFAGGNMFVYYSLSQAKDVVDEIKGRKRRQTAFRGPDMFVVLNIDGSYRRQKWVTWQEDSRTPDVIFEFLSPSTRGNDLGARGGINNFPI
jgi:Uma2 family endonuclease